MRPLSYWKGFTLELGKSLLEEAFSLCLHKFSYFCQNKLYKAAPKNPFILGRLFSKLSKTFSKQPYDSVQNRVGTLPLQGLAGKTAKRIIVLHIADVAGPHIEGFIDIDGTAYNIGVKRLTPERLAALNLKRNSDGWLTRESQERALELWAGEFELSKTRWLGQSTDHTSEEARMAWSSIIESVVGYGRGDLRQVLSDIPVSISSTGSSLEWVDPLVDRHRKCFVFKIMDQKEGVRPRNILGVGRKENPAPPEVEKLHLKFEQDPNKFLKKVGPNGLVTFKEDGASCKIRTGPKGSNFWSPRVSKVTGAQIMYDSKFRDWTSVKSPETTEGMGEFLAYKHQPILPSSVFASWLVNLFSVSRRLSAAEIGGLLNSLEPIPKNIRIELVVYLVSKVGRQSFINEPYSINYSRVKDFASLHRDWRPATVVEKPQIFVPLIPWLADTEGFVGVPEGLSLSEGGYKIKGRPDSIDAQITKVDFKPGPKGKIAGVVCYRDNKTGREHKISSGFSESMKKEIMENPEEFEGRVMVLNGFNGGSNRATKFFHFHTDKGAI